MLIDNHSLHTININIITKLPLYYHSKQWGKKSSCFSNHPAQIHWWAIASTISTIDETSAVFDSATAAPCNQLSWQPSDDYSIWSIVANDRGLLFVWPDSRFLYNSYWSACSRCSFLRLANGFVFTAGAIFQILLSGNMFLTFVLPIT